MADNFIIYNAAPGADPATIISDSQGVGVVFPFTQMSIAQVPVWAADGATQIGTAYTFNISGWIVETGQEALFTTMQKMRCNLTMPRKRFVVIWQDEGGLYRTFYEFDASEDRYKGDIAQGPKPGPLVFDAIIAGRAVPYHWSITAQVKECFTEACAAAPQKQLDILSLTRSFDHAVDADGLTTRTTTGTLVVPATVTRSKLHPADAYRAFVAPPLPANFKRESQVYNQSEDGRTLNFTIVDVEQVWTLPDPITGGQVNFTINQADDAEGGALAKTYYTLAGYFQAPRTVPKLTILQKIFNLFFAKMPQGGIEAFLLVRHEITEDVYGNKIAFLFHGWGPSGEMPGPQPFLYSGLKQINLAPPDSNGNAAMVQPYGGITDQGSGVVGARFDTYDACARRITYAPGAASQVTNTNRGEGRAGSAAGAGRGTANAGISADHKKAPYVTYRETVEFLLDNGMVVMDPKKKNVSPIVQQARAPALHVVQVGYAVRAGKSNADAPVPPSPIVQGTMLQASITPSNTPPIAGGQWRVYTLHWRYVMRYARIMSDALLSDTIKWPADPRFPGNKPNEGAVKQLPKLVI